MPTVAEHYDRVLADVYAWMLGGFPAALERNAAFFAARDVRPRGSAVAVDLGAGCGFQSIPLARAGFEVTAIDTDRKLLGELEENAAGLGIRTVRDDLLDFRAHLESAPELVVCMTDTILHLPAVADVERLFADVAAALEPDGRFVITFRDLSRPLEGLDRFVPVRSDETTIFTCFLEYGPSTVRVHDLVHRREGGGWRLHKSYYEKLRLSRDWVDDALARAGFPKVSSNVESGLVTVIAGR